MTPAELSRLLALVEVRRDRDLARLDAATAEDRMLAADIERLAATGERDMAEGGLPLAQQAARLAWADQRIEAARARRTALARELATLRAAAAQSLGKHRALEHVLERTARDEAKARDARDERNAPPAQQQRDTSGTRNQDRALGRGPGAIRG
jgi:hypothetical protein